MQARSALIVGPARIVRGSGSCHVLQPFTVDLVKSTTPLALDGYGVIDELDEDAIVQCSFTPDGRWNAAVRALLWPYIGAFTSPATAPNVGFDPFTAADVPTVIHDINAHLHTIKATAVTQMPSIVLSPVATMIGQTTITGIRGTGSDWATPASLHTMALTGGTFTDTSFLPTEIKVQDYSGAWDVSGFSDIRTTEGGWTIDFNTSIELIKVDEVGTCKGVLTGVSVMARCTPVAMTALDVIAAMDMQIAAARRGKAGNPLSADLVISGSTGSGVVTLKSAKLVRAGFRFGANRLRDGELGWVATRDFTSGQADAICTLA